MEKKILIIKIGAIGDIMLTMPFIKVLKKYIPCQITYLTLPYSKELVKDNPYITNIFTFNPFIPKIKKVKEAVKFLFLLKKQDNFDEVINLNRSLYSYLLAGYFFKSKRIGFKRDLWDIFLTKKIEFNCTKHEIYRYQDLLNLYGIEERDSQPCLYLSFQDEAFAKAFFKEYNLNPEEDKIIGIHPGGGINPGTVMLTKRWPISFFIELIKYIVNDLKFKVIVFGSKSEEFLAEEINKRLKNKKIIIATGKTKTIKSAAALIKYCKGFIGNDSGLLYIAWALDIPTLGLYGPSEPKLLAPIGEKHKYIKKDIPCSPCYHPATVHRRKFLECKRAICMELIKPEEVYPIVSRLF
jgi:lipopolysaccharide heptosyltransferase II